MLIFKYIKECNKFKTLFNLDGTLWNREKQTEYKDVDMERFARECIRQKKICIGIYDDLPIVVDKGDYKRLVLFNAVPSDERYDKAVHIGIVKNKQVVWDYYVKYAPGQVFIAPDEVIDYSYKNSY